MSVVAVLRSVRGAQGLKTPTQSTIWWPTSNSRHGSRRLDQLRSITSTYKDLDHSAAAYENLRRRPHDEEVWLDDLKCCELPCAGKHARLSVSNACFSPLIQIQIKESGTILKIPTIENGRASSRCSTKREEPGGHLTSKRSCTVTWSRGLLS